MDKSLLYNLIRNSARRYPNRIAIVDNCRSITYKQLDDLSSGIALSLIAMGCKSGAGIGVYLPKSIEAIITFIGILKAGALYIPLDTHYSPPERIRAILQLSDTRLLVTNIQTIKRLPLTEIPLPVPLKLLLTDTLFSKSVHTIPEEIPVASPNGMFTFFKQEESPPNTSFQPDTKTDDIAYILYTSGSTGIPKGVAITHHNALAFIEWAVDYFSFSDGIRFANHAPLHFDLSVFDMYVTFATGGTLYLVPTAVTMNPLLLAEWIDQKGIEVWYSVPSVWIALLNYAHLENYSFNNLRTIIFAGEVFPPKFLKMLMTYLPDRRYINFYGPTETNVCTYYEIPSVESVTDNDIPIGKACSGAVVAALDDLHHEVPIDHEGELYVMGPTVAAGYYRDRERTDASFILINGGNRWYRTGDIVKRITVDTYQYVGRIDSMVKCAGFRIEIQEVERVLSSHPDIREAAVIPYYRDTRGSTMLHGFYSLIYTSPITSLAIKQWCATHLPTYMVPEVLHLLPDFKRNSNGKIDRQLLIEHIIEMEEKE